MEYCYYICRNVRMQDVRMCEIDPVQYNKVTKIFLLPEAVFCPEKIDKRKWLCYNLLEYAKGETTYVSDDQ